MTQEMGAERAVRRSRRWILATVSVGVGMVAGCTGSTGDAGDSQPTVEETSQVSLSDSQFHPRNVHVDTGTTVTWTNDDSIEHTVTSASENWNVDMSVPPGASATHTFEDAGVYGVYCTIHGGSDLSGMSMKVGVGDATIEQPLGGGGGSGGGAYG